jgi:hypothetical protein
MAPKYITNELINDVVNSPSHYTDGGIETIDYIKAKLSREEFLGFLKGNALKYVSRAGKKQNMLQDYEKAVWYIDKLIDESKEEVENVSKTK